ncbi:unnamed protein product, partial [Staurois parvus]
NFYPEAVTIRWVKFSKSNSRNSPWDKDVSVTTLLGNSDGTFSVTSVLTVEPTNRRVNPEMYSSVLSATDPWRRNYYSQLYHDKTNPGIGISMAAVCCIHNLYVSHTVLRIGFIH